MPLVRTNDPRVVDPETIDPPIHLSSPDDHNIAYDEKTEADWLDGCVCFFQLAYSQRPP